ncbi:hypothetical protein F443_20566 [Phytophthora nicotianae P1569]|uniref:Uncharacterized protein n=1 Tax=Phytophthora nicotianae P1569 TaxID=1317065 RepID=V9E0Q4_PHYNI|nr:hypothetical protein F443_20566 [Phytophthora nicotianae P1569]
MARGGLWVNDPVLHARCGVVITLQSTDNSVAHDGVDVRVLAERLERTRPEWVARDAENGAKHPWHARCFRVTAGDTTLLVDEVRVERRTAINLLAEQHRVLHEDGAVHGVHAVHHRVTAVLLHRDLLDPRDHLTPLVGRPHVRAVHGSIVEGTCEVRAHAHLGVRAHLVVVDLVIFREELVDVNLGHLADNVVVGEGGHDGVGAFIPLVSGDERSSLLCGETQGRAQYCCKPRLEHGCLDPLGMDLVVEGRQKEK